MVDDEKTRAVEVGALFEWLQNAQLVDRLSTLVRTRLESRNRENLTRIGRVVLARRLEIAETADTEEVADELELLTVPGEDHGTRRRLALLLPNRVETRRGESELRLKDPVGPQNTDEVGRSVLSEQDEETRRLSHRASRPCVEALRHGALTAANLDRRADRGRIRSLGLGLDVRELRAT